MYNLQIFPAKPSSCWEKNHAKSNGAKITSLLLKKGCFQQNCVTGVSYIRLKKKTKELHWLLLGKETRPQEGKSVQTSRGCTQPFSLLLFFKL